MLLLFLNPEIDWSFGPVAATSLRFALPFAALSVVGLAALARFAGVDALRAIPWGLTSVLSAFALAAWFHASRFAFSLPPGINVQLLKAALWLSLAALVTFYTSLLHTLGRRRYGLRSVALFALLSAASPWAVAERRASFRSPRFAPPVLEPLGSEPLPHALVLIAPGATFDSLLPLADRGSLPLFSALRESGASGRLATLGPIDPLAAQATILTGKLPYRHGLPAARRLAAPWVGPGAELSLLPIGLELVPAGWWGAESRSVSAGDRTALTLVEILRAAGRTTRAIGLPAPLSDDVPEPAAMTPTVEIEGERRQSLASVRGVDLVAALADDLARLAASERLLASEAPPEVLVVQLAGLERAALRCQGGLLSVLFEGSRAGAARRAAAALEAYHVELDGAIARLWSRLPEPRMLIIASPYGVSPPRGASKLLAELERRRRVEGTLSGAPDGMLLVAGSGFSHGVRLADAAIADVVPTLLYALGLPIARDLDGRPLGAAFAGAILARRPFTFVSSYEGFARGEDAADASRRE